MVWWSYGIRLWIWDKLLTILYYTDRLATKTKAPKNCKNVLLDYHTSTRFKHTGSSSEDAIFAIIIFALLDLALHWLLFCFHVAGALCILFIHKKTYTYTVKCKPSPIYVKIIIKYKVVKTYLMWQCYNVAFFLYIHQNISSCVQWKKVILI